MFSKFLGKSPENTYFYYEQAVVVRWLRRMLHTGLIYNQPDTIVKRGSSWS
jgi:hypothetical protein